MYIFASPNKALLLSKAELIVAGNHDQNIIIPFLFISARNVCFNGTSDYVQTKHHPQTSFNSVVLFVVWPRSFHRLLVSFVNSQRPETRSSRKNKRRSANHWTLVQWVFLLLTTWYHPNHNKTKLAEVHTQVSCFPSQLVLPVAFSVAGRILDKQENERDGAKKKGRKDPLWFYSLSSFFTTFLLAGFPTCWLLPLGRGLLASLLGVLLRRGPCVLLLLSAGGSSVGHFRCGGSLEDKWTLGRQQACVWDSNRVACSREVAAHQHHAGFIPTRHASGHHVCGRQGSNQWLQVSGSCSSRLHLGTKVFLRRWSEDIQPDKKPTPASFMNAYCLEFMHVHTGTTS